MQWLLLLALLLTPEHTEPASAAAAIEAPPPAVSFLELAPPLHSAHSAPATASAPAADQTQTAPGTGETLLPFITEGESMSPTIESGDGLSVDPEYYRNHAPQRGDIVIFTAPDERSFVKRIVGLPGETIAIQKTKLFIDGKVVAGMPLAGCESVVDEIQLGPDELYVLGDNYSHSYDSRFIGPIRKSSIVGKVVSIEHRSS
ncbi:signal peptidase I [Paenibacillus chartarius]|uniref:Signal peptidase I n=1 Tax=Paenibacillus chartarius TaxID=747481 RepID=A0ABV6DKF6_9BACL